MSNNVFRFSVVYPLSAHPPNQLRSDVVLCRGGASELLAGLRSARADDDRGKVLSLAATYFKENAFFARDLKLASPFRDLDGKMTRSNMTLDELKDAIAEAFASAEVAAHWTDHVASAVFARDMSTLADCIVASVIVPSAEGLTASRRAMLLRWYRIGALLERASRNDEALKVTGNVERAMRAIVLLPKDIFPLPARPRTRSTPDNERDKRAVAAANAYSCAQGIDRLLKTKAELQRLLDEVSIPEREKKRRERFEAYVKTPRDTKSVRTAATAGRDLPSLSGLPKDTDHSLITDPAIDLESFLERDNSGKLTVSAMGRLSKDAHSSLKEANVVTDQPIDVSAVRRALDRRIAAMTSKLHSRKIGTRVVKVGTTFVSIDAPPALPSTPEPPDGAGTAPSVPSGHGTIRTLGYAELMMVRERVLKFVAAEPAHVENVLKGEEKTRSHKRTDEIEESFLAAMETDEELSRDLQTSDRSELQLAAEKEVEERLQIEANVEALYRMPNGEIKASVGGGYESTARESANVARTVAHEVTEQVVSRVRKQVKEQRSTRRRSLVEELNLHSIKNADAGARNIIGVYRWVNKVSSMEVLSLGRRLLLEAIIPEPAAFYLYAHTGAGGGGESIDVPAPPVYRPATIDPSWPLAQFLRFFEGDQGNEERPLEPGDLDENNYMYWVAKYNVVGVEPPPPEEKIYCVAICEKPENQSSNAVPTKLPDVTIDEGYEAHRAYVGGTIIPHEDGYLRVAVGKHVTVARGGDPTIDLSGETGRLPLTVVFYRIAAIGITVEVKCKRTTQCFERWQLKTFTAIVAAYNDLRLQSEERLASARIQAGIEIKGRNPLRNREVEKAELKRAALSVIMGEHFDVFDAMRVTDDDQPETDIAEAAAEGEYIQFFEQAFEWNAIGYVLYPYFWGRKKLWANALHRSDPDPKFQAFLQAGAARVVLPVRPGYEGAIGHYLNGGGIWNGGEPPQVEDDLYVSVVDAQREDQGDWSIDGPGSLTLVNGSNRVVGTGTYLTEDHDLGRELVIGGKTYRITQVLDFQTATLDRGYEDASVQRAPYRMGPKIVGAPWTVEVPTSLVHLQDDGALPNLQAPVAP